MSEQKKPNIRMSLMTIHKVISRGLEVSINHIGKYKISGLPNTEIRVGIKNYIRALTSSLRGHHLAEDDIAFPQFRNIVNAAPYGRLEEEHEEMMSIIESIETVIEDFKEGIGEREILEQIEKYLIQLQKIWEPHIEIEESTFSPAVMADLLSVETNLQLIKSVAEHSMKNSGPPFLVVPFILYNLPHDLRAILEKGMPEEVTQNLVPHVWKDQWASMKPFLLS